MTAAQEKKSPYKASWWQQFKAVFWRSFISVLKEPMIMQVRIIQTLVRTLIHSYQQKEVCSQGPKRPLTTTHNNCNFDEAQRERNTDIRGCKVAERQKGWKAEIIKRFKASSDRSNFCYFLFSHFRWSLLFWVSFIWTRIITRPELWTSTARSSSCWPTPPSRTCSPSSMWVSVFDCRLYSMKHS